MKVFIEIDNKYILLTDELEKDNFNNDALREEIVNQAMDKIEAYKLKKELKKQKEGGYLVKKLGVYPGMKKSA